MNDITLLTAALEREPANDIIGAMLVDELMSAKDMLRSEAERHVERVRLVAEPARQLAIAAELLKSKLRVGRALRSDIATDAGCEEWQNPTIVLAVGDRLPELCTTGPTGINRFWGTGTITVGALWVIDYAASWKRLECERMAHARAAKKQPK